MPDEETPSVTPPNEGPTDTLPEWFKPYEAVVDAQRDKMTTPELPLFDSFLARAEGTGPALSSREINRFVGFLTRV